MGSFWKNPSLPHHQHHAKEKPSVLYVDDHISGVLARHPADVGQAVAMALRFLFGGDGKSALCIPTKAPGEAVLDFDQIGILSGALPSAYSTAF